jgi:hypothetical protein
MSNQESNGFGGLRVRRGRPPLAEVCEGIEFSEDTPASTGVEEREAWCVEEESSDISSISASSLSAARGVRGAVGAVIVGSSAEPSADPVPAPDVRVFFGEDESTRPLQRWDRFDAGAAVEVCVVEVELGLGR